MKISVMIMVMQHAETSMTTPEVPISRNISGSVGMYCNSIRSEQSVIVDDQLLIRSAIKLSELT